MTSITGFEGDRTFSQELNPQNESRLMQLPWDLRQTIFQHILTHDEMLRPKHGLRGVKRYPNLMRMVEFMKSLPPYFVICQRFYHEAIEVFFTTNTFKVHVVFGGGTVIAVLQYAEMYPLHASRGIEFEWCNDGW